MSVSTMDNSNEVKIRFHLDENVSGAVAQGLRNKNIDVTTTDEANLIGVSDVEQLTYALSQNRVIFTRDADFLRLHKQGFQHAGIIYCSSASRLKCWIDFFLVPPELGARGLKSIYATLQIKLDALLLLKAKS